MGGAALHLEPGEAHPLPCLLKRVSLSSPRLAVARPITDVRGARRARARAQLSQIFIISDNALNAKKTEEYTNYHDVFVRHAFGSLRDIIKEVAYSPMMAVYLTYMNNKALFYDDKYPDENFARESARPAIRLGTVAPPRCSLLTACV